MKIDFTKEMIEMEPGPNLYFMGTMDEYTLLSEIAITLSNQNLEILLNDKFQKLEMEPRNLLISFRSSYVGNAFTKIQDDKIIVTLSPELWTRVASFAEVLSTKKGHIFIEFDNENVIEDYNMIWSSEW